MDGLDWLCQKDKHLAGHVLCIQYAHIGLNAVLITQVMSSLQCLGTGGLCYHLNFAYSNLFWFPAAKNNTSFYCEKQTMFSEFHLIFPPLFCINNTDAERRNRQRRTSR
jgi:hypothetical protein